MKGCSVMTESLSIFIHYYYNIIHNYENKPKLNFKSRALNTSRISYHHVMSRIQSQNWEYGIQDFSSSAAI